MKFRVLFCGPVCKLRWCLCGRQVAVVVAMADGTVGGQQQVRLQSSNSSENGVQDKRDEDAPLDFSIKRDHVTPPPTTTTTSFQARVTSLPVAAAAPPPLLFPQLMDPAVMSALSAAGLLLRTPTGCVNPVAPTSPPGVVTDQVRAYVQSKIAEEQRRILLQRASLTASSSSTSSSSADSSEVERTAVASPPVLRSSPTSTTTTPSVVFDALPQRWPPVPAMPPPPPSSLSASSDQYPSTAAAAAVSRKRLSSYSDNGASTNTKDVHYWERRRKNNEAAKRSRDARRAKEEDVALRASMLEQENRQLRVELTAFRLEVARLSELLCRQVAQQQAVAPTSVAGPSQNSNSPR